MQIHIPKSFRKLFMVPENTAERALVECLINSVRLPLEYESRKVLKAERLASIVDEVVQTKDRRSMHLFEPKTAVSKLIASGTISKPRFIQPEDQQICLLGLAWRVDSHAPRATLSGAGVCLQFLSNTVDTLWSEIADRLSVLDRRSLILKSLNSIEAIQRDREHWTQTARAMMASHDATEVTQVSQRRETERVRASLAGRVLVEMGLCSCPSQNGVPTSQSIYDDLLARVISLIEFATWSDAIHYRLATDKVHILASGAIKVDMGQFAEIIQKYASETFSQSLMHAIEGYPRLYEEPEVSEVLAKEIYGDRFLAAFSAEYGISPDECKRDIF